jgi:hypothetical protein
MMATEITSNTEAQEVAETGDREAIIFIPAIGRGWDDPSIEGVARRIAFAIDRQSITEKAKAHVEVAEQEYGSGYKCKMFTITKSDGKSARPLIDVFGLDYNDTLVENYEKRTLLTKIILLAVTLFDSFWRLLIRFHKKSKGIKEKIQLAYGLLVSGLLVVYLAFLIIAVVSSVEQLRKTDTAKTQSSIPAQATPVAPQTGQNAATARQLPPAQAAAAGGVLASVGGALRKALGAVSGVVKGTWNFIKRQRTLFPPVIVLVTALGFILPPKVKVKEKISLAATNYLCLIHYLNWGERSHAIGGKLESLLEYLVEREKGYKKIHIIGYSFGSIVALDNLFAQGAKPIERFNRIDTLVTIGCPFDIIRTYWPEYFKGRYSLTPNAPKWINVYSPIDILSSNFANCGNDQQVNAAQHQDIGIEVEGQIRKPENLIFTQGSYQGLGVVDILTLAGFKAHSLYWGEEVKGEITCFHGIVKKMYQDTSILN